MHKMTSALGLLLLLGCGRSASVPEAPDADVSRGTVTLEIVTDSSTESIEVPDVAAGTTLETVMRSVTEIPVDLKGSGTTAFVNAIGDRATGRTDGWTFTVDGAFANQGIGKTALTPPTTVTWTFGAFDQP